MTKETLLVELQHDGQETEAALRDLRQEMLTASGVCGTWSFKDVLAHVSAQDEWTAEQLEALARGDPPPSAAQRAQWAAEGLMDVQSRNDVLYRASRFRPPQEVTRAVVGARRRLIAAVAGLPETRLAERHWFTGSWTVREAVAKVVEHAREHRIQAMAELVAP